MNNNRNPTPGKGVIAGKSCTIKDDHIRLYVALHERVADVVAVANRYFMQTGVVQLDHDDTEYLFDVDMDCSMTIRSHHTSCSISIPVVKSARVCEQFEALQFTRTADCTALFALVHLAQQHPDGVEAPHVETTPVDLDDEPS